MIIKGVPDFLLGGIAGAAVGAIGGVIYGILLASKAASDLSDSGYLTFGKGNG